MVSILSDDYVDYEFQEKMELKKVMKDYLEESVEEKYYINNEKARKLIEQLIVTGGLENVDGLNLEPDGTCRTIKAQYAKSSAANFG